MIIRRSILRVLFISLLLLSFAGHAEATYGVDDYPSTFGVDPFEYFNVYSLGNMGQSDNIYPTDIQGTIGVAGHAYLGLGIGSQQTNEYSLHTGGDVFINEGSMYGKFDIGGNANIDHFAVNYDLHAGGNVTLGPDASVAANIYDVTDGYTPMFDYAALNQYYLDTSANIGGLAATATMSAPYSTVYFNVSSGINVFEVDATDLYANYSRIVVDGPSDAVVYINATDISANLGWSLNWDFLNGASQDNVILNFENATTLTVKGGEINVLAPKAVTYFPAGTITGNLIVGDLPDGWQVNDGSFDPPTVVPEPISSTLFLVGAATLGFRRFRKTIKN